MNDVLNVIKRDLKLLVESPREYLFSFTYPDDDKIVIRPYDPAVTKLGESLVEKIHKSSPNLKVYFYGSAALKVSGQRDVDIMVECLPRELPRYLPRLKKIFGEPTKKRREFVEWHRKMEGCSLDLMIINPNHIVFREILKVYEALKNDQNLLKKYEDLKIFCNGVSSREYKRRRLEFFHQMMAIYKN
jgi:predicted nucleotidyltransferase